MVMSVGDPPLPLFCNHCGWISPHCNHHYGYATNNWSFTYINPTANYDVLDDGRLITLREFDDE